MNKNQRFRKLIENRNCARMRRLTKAWLLEMHRNGPSYRAFKKEYEEWTKTPEYQKECERIKELSCQVDEYLAQEAQMKNTQ